jgi:carbonic anhydrase
MDRSSSYCIFKKEVNISRHFYFFSPGPSFWGLINPQWMLCNKGRRQSPIDIEPAKMLYDPNLRPLSVDKHKVVLFS